MRLRGYIRGRGAPRNSHFLLFLKYLCRQLCNGDGIYACVLLRIFIKRVITSATLRKDEKNLVGSKVDLIWDFLTRRFLFVFPLIPKGVFVGRFTRTKIKVIFHPYFIYYAGQHSIYSHLSFHSKESGVQFIIALTNTTSKIFSTNFSTAKNKQGDLLFHKKRNIFLLQCWRIQICFICRWRI